MLSIKSQNLSNISASIANTSRIVAKGFATLPQITVLHWKRIQKKKSQNNWAGNLILHANPCQMVQGLWNGVGIKICKNI